MPRLPVEVLTTDEVERLIAAPDQEDVFGLRDAAILATLYYGAVTASDLAGLDLRDIDLEDRTLRVRDDSARTRRVPLEDPLVEVLVRYLEESRRLIIAQAGGPDAADVAPAFITNRGHRIQVQDVRQLLGAHAKACGIDTSVNTNTLRLSRAWHLREAGTSPETIQRLLGTSNRSGRRLF